MTHNLNLPADFENYPDMRKRGFLRMKELKENGAKVVGVFCSFVPLEIVYAAGMVPVGLCSFTDEPIPAAEPQEPLPLDQGQLRLRPDGHLPLLLLLRPGGGGDHL